MNLKMGALEIQKIIDSIWMQEDSPYIKQIGKWMGENDEFDPAKSEESEWVDPKELVYKNLQFTHYNSGNILISSDIEIWHAIIKFLPSSFRPVYSIITISTSVATTSQRYFVNMRSGRGRGDFEEIQIGQSPDLRKRRTVTGGLTTSTIQSLLEKPRVQYVGEDIPVLNLITENS